MVKINWADAKKKIIPDDTEVDYTVNKATFVEKSQSSGQPMVNVMLGVDSPDEWAGVTLFRTFSLQPTALWAFREFLIASHAPESLLAEDSDMDIEDVCNDIIGLQGKCVVSVEMYKPKNSDEEQETNRIKKFIKPGFDVFAVASNKK